DRMRAKRVSAASEIRRMLRQKINPRAHYYFFTLDAGSKNLPTWSSQTGWVGFTPGRQRHEIRRARHVNAILMRKMMSSFGEPPLVINKRREFPFYLLFGGHALIADSVATDAMPKLLLPYPAIVQAGQPGYTSLESIPVEQTHRAPSKKLRMKVLKRDK